jgi:hypothetical protein
MESLKLKTKVPRHNTLGIVCMHHFFCKIFGKKVFVHLIYLSEFSLRLFFSLR